MLSTLPGSTLQRDMLYTYYGFLVLAIFALGLGVFMLAKPDKMWQYRQWKNRASGLAVGERTKTWERMNRLGAIFVILTGIGTGVVFWQVNQFVAEEAARRERSRALPPPSLDPRLRGISDMPWRRAPVEK